MCPTRYCLPPFVVAPIVWFQKLNFSPAMIPFPIGHCVKCYEWKGKSPKKCAEWGVAVQERANRTWVNRDWVSWVCYFAVVLEWGPPVTPLHTPHSTIYSIAIDTPFGSSKVSQRCIGRNDGLTGGFFRSSLPGPRELLPKLFRRCRLSPFFQVIRPRSKTVFNSSIWETSFAGCTRTGRQWRWPVVSVREALVLVGDSWWKRSSIQTPYYRHVIVPYIHIMKMYHINKKK